MDDIDELVKQKALEASDELKNAPEWMQNYQLLAMCKMDKTGEIEKIARCLASYGIKSEKIVPCLMELLQIIIRKGS